MPTLLVQTDDARYAAVFRARALIGRKAVSGISIDHREVSRLHAWIDRDADSFYLADAASRNGTRVDGVMVLGRTRLDDGAEIAIGPATITFCLDDAAAAGQVVTEITPAGTCPGVADDGILFKCDCGAPIWAPPRMAGGRGRCVHCDQVVQVPTLEDAPVPVSARARALAAAPAEAAPAMSIFEAPRFVPTPTSSRPATPLDARAASRPAKLETCTVCQCEILSTDAKTACPDCGLTFHVECWEENRGCSAYGCPQVNVLDPDAPRNAPPQTVPADADDGRAVAAAAAFAAPAKEAVPWEFVLLAGSVFSTILGAFTFGVPPLAVGGAAVVRAARKQQTAAALGVCLLSAGIALLGVAVGVVVSRTWWLGAPLWSWGK